MVTENPTPEDNHVQGWLAAGGLAIVTAVVPFAGPLIQSAGTEALRLAQRERDEQWMAMTGARIYALEKQGAPIRAGDPEFLAAMTRLHRAAAESADDEKRALLARAAANAGAWSPTPHEERAEFVDIVAALLPMQVAILVYFDDPFGGPAVIKSDDERVDIVHWVELLFKLPRPTVERHIAVLETRGLLAVPRGMQYQVDVVRQLTTPFGHSFLEFLREGP